MNKQNVLKRRGLRSAKILSLVFFLLSATSFAQEATVTSENQEHSVGIGFGQVILAGEFAKTFSDSLGLDLIYNYYASEAFGLFVDAHYSKHTDSKGKNVLLMRGVSPNLRANFSYVDKLTFYGIGGFGIYKINETIGPINGNVVTFGLNAGAGFDLKLADHMQFGTLVSFHNIFTKSDPDAVNPSGGGMSIGGTFLRLFINIQYIF